MNHRLSFRRSEVHINLTSAFVALAGVLVVSSSFAADKPYDNPDWQQAVEKTIESYIRSHPEVIEQALQALETKRQEEEKQRVKVAIAAGNIPGVLLQFETAPGGMRGPTTGTILRRGIEEGTQSPEPTPGAPISPEQPSGTK